MREMAVRAYWVSLSGLEGERTLGGLYLESIVLDHGHAGLSLVNSQRPHPAVHLGRAEGDEGGAVRERKRGLSPQPGPSLSVSWLRAPRPSPASSFRPLASFPSTIS